MAARSSSAGCIWQAMINPAARRGNAHPVRNPRGRKCWYLDTFVKGPGYAQVLVDPARLHPLGRWYHVAQTFDGTTYRSYVNGVLEGEARVAFTPQGPGSASVAMRRNGVNHFHGAIARRASPIARWPPRFPAAAALGRPGPDAARQTDRFARLRFQHQRDHVLLLARRQRGAERAGRCLGLARHQLAIHPQLRLAGHSGESHAPAAQREVTARRQAGLQQGIARRGWRFSSRPART
jgi:hypothetical protein